MKIGLPLTKELLTTLAKSVLVPLGLKTLASAGDACIHKNLSTQESHI